MLKVRYIQRKSPEGLETVDEFDNRKDALDALKNYQQMKDADYYISARCCKHWKEK